MTEDTKQQIAFIGMREFDPLYGGIEKYAYELTSELYDLNVPYKVYL